jgi:Tfp pilus assembly protein PilV
MIEALLTVVLFFAIVLGLPSMLLDLADWF